MSQESNDLFCEATYLNFTAMHGIQSIITRVRALADATLRIDSTVILFYRSFES
nr:hypothetical protein IICANGFA_00016 [Gallid alphaherpesvirus 2]